MQNITEQEYCNVNKVLTAELNETHMIRKQKLRSFQELIKEKYGKSFDDELLLIRFLRVKKFNTLHAIEMLDKYLLLKISCPELFKVSPVTDIAKIYAMQIQLMLPLDDDFGKLIYIYRVGKLDPSVPVDLVFRSNILALEAAIRDYRVQIGGLIVILDLSGVKLAHLKYLTPHLAKKTIEVVQDAFPLRFKAFHILNQPFYFNTVLSLLKPLIKKEKLRHRIYTHGSNFDSLHEYIPQRLLPQEYGGTLGTFDNFCWSNTILDDATYFDQLETELFKYKNT